MIEQVAYQKGIECPWKLTSSCSSHQAPHALEKLSARGEVQIVNVKRPIVDDVLLVALVPHPPFELGKMSLDNCTQSPVVAFLAARVAEE